MSDHTILKMWVNMSEWEKTEFNKYITIRYDIRINPEYAKTLVTLIDGCQACGATYDQVQRRKEITST